MTKLDRTLLRAAVRIHERLLATHAAPETPTMPESAWDECRRLAHRLAKAESRGWWLAARQLRHCWDIALSSCRVNLSDFIIALHEVAREVSVPTIHDIYEELLSLADEFSNVRCDLQTGVLSVQSDDIVLESVSFGTFEIRLRLADIGDDQPYKVVALDPHPAISNSDATHPHVLDGKLCEGDGTHPIRNALRSGRLFDFFTVIIRILSTYNGSSAYSRLDDWDGVSCSDCGATLAEEDSYSCHDCHSTLCEMCETTCARCDGYYCGECVDCCGACEDRICSGCRDLCIECHKLFCLGCLTEERCENCHAQHSNSEGSNETESTSETPTRCQPADAALQPPRLGEAHLSAG